MKTHSITENEVLKHSVTIGQINKLIELKEIFEDLNFNEELDDLSFALNMRGDETYQELLDIANSFISECVSERCENNTL